MTDERQEFEQKSIRYVLDAHKDMQALASDCVGLANARGGSIVLGIEDGMDDPPPGQTVPADLADNLRKGRETGTPVFIDQTGSENRPAGQ